MIIFVLTIVVLMEIKSIMKMTLMLLIVVVMKVVIMLIATVKMVEMMKMMIKTIMVVKMIIMMMLIMKIRMMLRASFFQFSFVRVSTIFDLNLTNSDLTRYSDLDEVLSDWLLLTQFQFCPE